MQKESKGVLIVLYMTYNKNAMYVKISRLTKSNDEI